MRSHTDAAPAPGWLAAASVLGFAVTAVFSWGLQWSRSVFLLPYLALAGAFVLLYFRRHPLPPARWTAHAPQALAAVAIAVFLLWRNIQGQPASASPQGLALAGTLAWAGLAYGAMDALLLNVVPVLAVGGPPTERSGAGVRQAIAGLLASILVTVAYHAGYTEFHGPAMAYVVIGNVIITSTYLASGNPLAPVATHVAMHVLAVLHGMETTLQLPPHYGG